MDYGWMSFLLDLARRLLENDQVVLLVSFWKVRVVLLLSSIMKWVTLNMQSITICINVCSIYEL